MEKKKAPFGVTVTAILVALVVPMVLRSTFGIHLGTIGTPILALGIYFSVILTGTVLIEYVKR